MDAMFLGMSDADPEPDETEGLKAELAESRRIQSVIESGDVQAAIAYMKRSERGTQALKDYKRLVDNGGYGLDSINWAALATLCKAQYKDPDNLIGDVDG